LGQQAKTAFTFLRYRVVLGHQNALELLEEELIPIPKKDIEEHILFPQSDKWYQSVFLRGQRKQPFISTQHKKNERLITLHGEGKSRLSSQSANNLPATVLSSVTRAEHPTALLAKREMQSWRLLQLEPSALRQSDEFSLAPASLGHDGSHLAKTLHTLALNETTEQQIYGQVANRLAELIDDVRALKVVHDNQRDLLTVEVAGRDGIFHPARFLSDGTLRFLALAVLEQSAEGGLWCIEEPENGIHPGRIEAIIRLLEDIAMDTAYPIDSDNPFRQIIINTHSPSVVASVPDESLLVAELKDTIHQTGQHFKRAHFACLPDTWRTKENVSQVTKGRLLDYLNPIVRTTKNRLKAAKRVIKNRPDLQMMLP
jgi:predicted ATPase